ncbi:MAG: hypothetical protein JNL70_13905 [Saprospiraceae bacterium]|nr:hypothetical protein [Saprospiraceae bacterium]
MSSLLNRPQLDIEKFINKGGTSTTVNPLMPDDNQSETPRRQRGRPKGSIKEEPPMRVEMRIPPRILEKIDQVVLQDPILTSRHAWLLKAILEKVERDLDNID